MMLPKHATVAVADGETLRLFRNAGDETHVDLTALPMPSLDAADAGSGGRHHSSSANPDDKRASEDNFAASCAAYLNREVLEGRIESLVIIADPRSLGELRKHYHQKLQDILLKDMPKDLAGHVVADIAAAVHKA